MTRVGTGYVEIQPDWSGFDNDVRRHLKSVGDSAGQDFAKGITGGLAPTRGAFNSFERDGTASFKSVGNSAKRAGDDLKRLYADISRQNVSRALGDTDQAAKKTARSFLGLGSAAGGSGGGFDRASRSLAGFGEAGAGATATIGGLRIALVALVPVTVGFGGALVAVAGALLPLAGLAAAAGNALGAAAQGMGVFKLATFGVSDALKEQIDNQTTAGATAASNAGQQRAAARAIQSAQDGVRNALEGVRQATVGVTDAEQTQHAATAALAPAISKARMNLVDMREAVTDAARSLKGARLAADDARQSLADLVAGPSARVLADAHHAVTDALRGEATAARALDDAHQGVTTALRGEEAAAQALADAHKALNDLLKPPDVLDVADATDAVADAVRNEERAQLDLADQAKKTTAVLASQGGIDVFGPSGLQRAPAVTDEEKAKARLDLADAENSVGDATRATQRARQALAALEKPPDADAVAAATRRIADAETAVGDASRATADARQRVSDAEYGVTEAARGTQNARQDLATLEAPASAHDLAAARLQVADAENSVRDATVDHARAVRDLTQADRLGIKGAQDVVDARNAIADADRGVRDAERALADAQLSAKRASQALSDAQLSAKESAAGLAGATANLNKKFDDLPPAAQAFVRVLQSMKPKLDELRQTAAKGFFPGATEGLRSAAGSFDEVNHVVAETSRVLGDAARKSGELVGSPAFGRDIVTIGHSNAQVLDTLGEAARHVVSALRNIAVEAGPLTRWLADLANKWALNAAQTTKSWRETGKLADFFDKTRQVTERLLSIIGHLGSGLLGVGKAGADSGNDILASIDRAAKRFDDWANDKDNQKKIKDFFEEAKNLAAGLTDVLAGVAKGIALVTLKMLPLSEILKLLGPYADEATIAFVAYKIAAYALAAASTAVAFATGEWVTAFWALNAALAANPIVLVTAALAAMAAGLIYAYLHVEPFRKAVDDTFTWIKEHWPLLAEIFTGPIGFAVIEIVRHWGTLKQATIDAWTAVKNTVTAAANAIVSTLGAAWNTILTAASAAWGAIREAVLTPIRAARDAIPDIGAGISNRLSTAWEEIKGAAGAAWDFVRDAILAPIRAARDALPDVMTGMLTRLAEGWDAIKKGVGGFAKDVRDSVLDAIKGALNELIGFVNDVIGAINAIPGVPNIHKVDKLAEGGEVKARAFARGGAFARTGGIVDSPMVLMGEEAPMFPEFVIPTNPAYRDRAQMLLGRAAGMIGLAEGGVIDAFRAAIKRTHATAKPSLALFEAGVVESGLSNLPYGDRDSRGALQVRDITARALGIDNMDPLAVAVAFLNRGYWGKGGAISLAAHNTNQSAGWVAQNTQGSAFPDRYDQVRDQALKYLTGDTGGGGGIVSAITGAVGDLLSKGVGWVLDKLPGVSGLPDWLKGVGSYIIDHATDWIRGTVHDITGLARGGLVPAYAGSFADGGIVPGPTGTPRLIEAHAGEAVLPPGMVLHADIYIGGQRIDERVDVRLQLRDRATAGAWNAGVIA